MRNSESNKIKIGIIGLGYVGGALRYWLETQKEKHELFFYDKFKNIGGVEEVNKADIIFVCVPTPFYDDGRGYDDSAVQESLGDIKNSKTVVIKSTILPGSSNNYQKDYPEKTILFNPEFLRAKTAREDFLNPTLQIVGYVNNTGEKIAQDVLNILPQAYYSRIVKAKEAEMVKYFINTFLATRVIFANQIYDFCQKLGNVDYDVIREAVIQDKRIGTSHFEIFHDGYRGYSGACLPKDTKAFLKLGEKLDVDLELLKKVNEINEELQKNNAEKA